MTVQPASRKASASKSIPHPGFALLDSGFCRNDEVAGFAFLDSSLRWNDGGVRTYPGFAFLDSGFRRNDEAARITGSWAYPADWQF